jgi:hypothetical protein
MPPVHHWLHALVPPWIWRTQDNVRDELAKLLGALDAQVYVIGDAEVASVGALLCCMQLV